MSISNEELNFQEENDIRKNTNIPFLNLNPDNQSNNSKTIEISSYSDKSINQNQGHYTRRSSALNTRNLHYTNKNCNLNDYNNDNESERNILVLLKSFSPTKGQSKNNLINEHNQLILNDQIDNSKKSSLKKLTKDKENKILESMNKNSKIYSSHKNIFSGENKIKIKHMIGNSGSKTVKKDSNSNTINVEKDDAIKKHRKIILLSKVKNLLEEIKNEKKNKTVRINKKKRKIKDASHLFLERNVLPQIPFLTDRFKINNYLINDFKEKESHQEYIKRSLKYQVINENYETEKEKNLEKNYNRQENIDETYSRSQNQKTNEYSYNPRSIYGKKMYSTINISSRNNFYKNFRNGTIKRNNNKKLSYKKNNNIGFLDKFTLSNNKYNAHKRYFSEYQMKKRKLRSENFSIQMSNLEKDKHLYVTEENEENEDENNSPKLEENKLLYLIQLKNTFKKSFNTMTTFKKEDQDLGLDNLERIKRQCLETEVQMFAVLKDKTYPSYIKNNFNKKTNKKYRSTRGVFFGA